jgi:hypothetical protein
MRRLLATILVLACATAAPAKERHRAMQNPLSWKLSKSADGQKLVVDITLTNTGKKKLYVVDKLVVPAPGPGGKLMRSDRITVMNTENPDEARFVLGAVSSDRPSMRLYTPTYERVAAGATVTRHFELPLPLASWNPVGGTNPLSPTTKRAKLVVIAFSGEPAEWRTLPSDDPEPLRVPEFERAPTIFETGPDPLP